MTTSNAAASLRRRLLARQEALLGTFIKSVSTPTIEILGDVGFDFAIIDAEHAPIDRQGLDLLLLASRAVGLPCLVRVPEATPGWVLGALDAGAAGVVVPHVSSAAESRRVVRACRYAGGGRGFSNSPRAGRYGARSQWQHVDAADEEVTVVAMIEDPEAVEAIDDIVAIDGLDALFIGRADLGVALDDRAAGSPRVADATRRVLAAADRAGKAACLLASGPDEAQRLRAAGASAFVLSSDQGLLRQAATSTLKTHRQSLA